MNKHKVVRWYRCANPGCGCEWPRSDDDTVRPARIACSRACLETVLKEQQRAGVQKWRKITAAAATVIPVIALVAIIVFAMPAAAACEYGGCRHYSRSRAVWREFVETVPCPIQVTEDGDCPMTIDHFLPLCLGGPDAAVNLWWEDRARAEWKDEIELRACRAMRRAERAGDGPQQRRVIMLQ